MAEPVFSGFAPAAFAWFAGLEAENTRDWFHAHRDTFDDEVRAPFGALLDELADGGATKVFRQHRDLRFARDKTPYKTRTYGLVAVPGSAAARYAEVSASGLYAGTGYHALAPDQLARYREAVDAEATGPALERAVAEVEAAGLEVAGHALRTAPRGYARDHPRIALLRRRGLFAGARRAPGADGIPREVALAHLGETWAAAAPLVGWLDAHVGPGGAPG